jgi:HEAT repeat protein
LQDFSRLIQKPIALFIDGLDIILPHTDTAVLVSQLNELASNAVLICSSRPSEYQLLKEAATPKATEIVLEELSLAQVNDILQQARSDYHVHIEDLDPKLIQMCQNPFILHLLLEASKTERLPRIVYPTETRVREAYWRNRIERVRPQAFKGHRFGRLSKEDVGRTKAAIAYRIAWRMLETQTYQLSLEAVEGLLQEVSLEETSNTPTTKQIIYRELVAEGVIREGTRIRFLHDSFADFVICKQILESPEWLSTIDWLLERIGSPFYVSIIVHLVLQLHDVDRSAIEDEVYQYMVRILEQKRQSQHMMNCAWGVTYALHQLSAIWAERFCATLERRCPQETASSLASVLGDVRHPRIVPVLSDCLHFYRYKKRFIDSLGMSHDPSAVEPLLALLERLYEDEDLEPLENIAIALQKIGDARAQPLLERIEQDTTLPLAARRAARAALLSLTGLARYSESIPYSDEEFLEGLRIHDTRDRSRYSDWKMVKQTADTIATQVGARKSVSPVIIQALIEALDHEHEDAQDAVVKSLSIIDTPLAVNRLTEKVLDSHTPDAIREAVATSFAKMATHSTIDEHDRERMCKVLDHVADNDPNPQVRLAAQDTLHKIHNV